MTQRHLFKADKLVRNRTNERLAKQNVYMKFHVLDAPGYIKALKAKLVEESQEVAEAQNTEELISELADVMEVIHALTTATNISLDAIEASRQEKLIARGGFDQRTYSEYVDIDESHHLYQHYKNSPDKYPEVALVDSSSQ